MLLGFKFSSQKPVDANERKKVDNMKRERSITRGPLTFVRTLTSSSSGNPNHYLEDQLSTREITYFSYSNLFVSKRTPISKI